MCICVYGWVWDSESRYKAYRAYKVCIFHRAHGFFLGRFGVLRFGAVGAHGVYGLCRTPSVIQNLGLRAFGV